MVALLYCSNQVAVTQTIGDISKEFIISNQMENSLIYGMLTQPPAYEILSYPALPFRKRNMEAACEPQINGKAFT